MIKKETTEDKVQKLQQARENTKMGLRIIFMSIMRIFIESFVAMLLINYIASERSDNWVDLGYWETLFSLLLFRILTGQIKLKTEIKRNK
jgi:hypothetical protein